MTAQEHIEWCKRRALEYVQLGQLEQAFASMVLDLGKHDETCLLAVTALTTPGLLCVMNDDTPGVRRWIEEFG